MSWKIQNNDFEFGGKNIVVQIDESKLMKFKSHKDKDRRTDDRYVFGLYGEETKNALFQIFPNRTQSHCSQQFNQ